jgi:hypothetical protein
LLQKINLAIEEIMIIKLENKLKEQPVTERLEEEIEQLGVI